MKKIILKEKRKIVLTEKKKKKGFTIIEMSVVLSIIVLLMAVFLPTVSGAIEDSKNAGIKGEAQTIVFAWQTINSKTDLNLDIETNKTKLVEEAGNNKEFSKYFNLNKTKSLSGNVTVEECMQVVEGKNFTINAGGEITITKD